MADGREERLLPDEFIARIDHETRDRRFFYRLLNITGPVGVAWVLLGLLGQVIFAGRMIYGRNLWFIYREGRTS